MRWPGKAVHRRVFPAAGAVPLLPVPRPAVPLCAPVSPPIPIPMSIGPPRPTMGILRLSPVARSKWCSARSITIPSAPIRWKSGSNCIIIPAPRWISADGLSPIITAPGPLTPFPRANPLLPAVTIPLPSTVPGFTICMDIMPIFTALFLP